MRNAIINIASRHKKTAVIGQANVGPAAAVDSAPCIHLKARFRDRLYEDGIRCVVRRNTADRKIERIVPVDQAAQVGVAVVGTEQGIRPDEIAQRIHLADQR